MGKSEKRQRTKLVAVRFLPAEYERIKALADANNVSVSELIRRVVTPLVGVGL